MSYRIQNLGFSYGPHPVLTGVALNIESGEFVAIVGPNGAGKSTLLKLMAGLVDASDGSIDFMAQPIGKYSPAALARRVAFVPQETHVAFPFTAEEIVRMGRLPYRDSFLFDDADDDVHVAHAMELTETTDLADVAFMNMSGGERQRVVLASALAQTPAVLLLDEPTVYLGLKHQIHFYEILARLNRQQDLTIVAVTHDLNLAARYAARMVAIADGGIAADGRPDTVLTPETLNEVFGITADILERPGGGRIVIPIG
jgi:iron complex transport system ATP-binding protein